MLATLNIISVKAYLIFEEICKPIETMNSDRQWHCSVPTIDYNCSIDSLSSSGQLWAKTFDGFFR